MEIVLDAERLIEIRIIQEDAETVFSLLRTERDPIFAMAIAIINTLNQKGRLVGYCILKKVYFSKIINIDIAVRQRI